jgi:hypothetical protein
MKHHRAAVFAAGLLLASLAGAEARVIIEGAEAFAHAKTPPDGMGPR